MEGEKQGDGDREGEVHSTLIKGLEVGGNSTLLHPHFAIVFAGGEPQFKMRIVSCSAAQGATFFALDP